MITKTEYECMGCSAIIASEEKVNFCPICDCGPLALVKEIGK